MRVQKYCSKIPKHPFPRMSFCNILYIARSDPNGEWLPTLEFYLNPAQVLQAFKNDTGILFAQTEGEQMSKDLMAERP